MLEGIKDNGIFLLNCIWDDTQLCTHLPVAMKKEILEKKIRFYTINAAQLGEELGLGKRINMIMTDLPFSLCPVISRKSRLFLI